MISLLFGEPRALTLSPDEIRLFRRYFGVILAITSALALLVGLMLPRYFTYGAVLDENLGMRGQLQALDQRMDEVDRALLRLRLYEAQAGAISQPTGPHGPVSEEEMVWVPGTSRDLLLELGDLSAMEFEPSDMHPTDAWALGVRARTEVFLDQFASVEPDVQQMMAELRDLKSLERAFPSQWPTQGIFTSPFGFRRSPVRPFRTRFHAGVDIANKRGTPIVAVAPGEIVEVDWDSGYGKKVEIAHGYGISTLYAHCQSISAKVGDRVAAGDRIALMGNTGRSTGPHLHFEVRVDGHPVDPLDYLPR